MCERPSLKWSERRGSVVINMSQREDLETDVRDVVNCQAASQHHLVLRKRLVGSPHYADIARKALHLTTEIVKVKVKFPLEHATKAQRWSRGIALLFL